MLLLVNKSINNRVYNFFESTYSITFMVIEFDQNSNLNEWVRLSLFIYYHGKIILTGISIKIFCAQHKRTMYNVHIK